MARELQPCGTVAAHRRHSRNGEPSCDACRAEMRRVDAERRRRNPRPKRAAPSLRERLFSKLIIEPGTGCLIWAGSRTAQGYGHLSVSNRMAYVHRLTWELFNEPVPDGLELDHLCRVRHCASPAHLEPVSHRVNILRGENFSAVHAAKTHCPAGHPYDETNTGWSQGSRRCRTCRREQGRRAYARRRGTGEDTLTGRLGDGELTPAGAS